jgi:uracil phosphoribosyltransferase
LKETSSEATRWIIDDMVARGESTIAAITAIEKEGGREKLEAMRIQSSPCAQNPHDIDRLPGAALSNRA